MGSFSVKSRGLEKDRSGHFQRFVSPVNDEIEVAGIGREGEKNPEYPRIG